MLVSHELTYISHRRLPVGIAGCRHMNQLLTQCGVHQLLLLLLLALLQGSERCVSSLDLDSDSIYLRLRLGGVTDCIYS